MPHKNSILEIALFDISYIISNCDDEYSFDEKEYLNKILENFDLNQNYYILEKVNSIQF